MFVSRLNLPLILNGIPKVMKDSVITTVSKLLCPSELRVDLPRKMAALRATTLPARQTQRLRAVGLSVHWVTVAARRGSHGASCRVI